MFRTNAKNTFSEIFKDVDIHNILGINRDDLRDILFNKWSFRNLVPNDLRSILKIEPPVKRYSISASTSDKELDHKRRLLDYIFRISSLSLPSKTVEKPENILDYRPSRYINFLLPPFINSIYHEFSRFVPELFEKDYIIDRELVKNRFLQRVLDPSYQFKEGDSSIILEEFLNIKEEDSSNKEYISRLKKSLDQVLQSSYLIRFSLLPKEIRQIIYDNPYFPYFIPENFTEAHNLINRHLINNEEYTEKEIKKIEESIEQISDYSDSSIKRLFKELMRVTERQIVNNLTASSYTIYREYLEYTLSLTYKIIDETFDRLKNIKLTHRQHLLRKFLDGDIEPYLLAVSNEPEILKEIEGKHYKYVKYVLMMYEGLTVDPRIIYRIQKDKTFLQKVKDKVRKDLEEDHELIEKLGYILVSFRNYLKEELESIRQGNSINKSIKVPAKDIHNIYIYLMSLAVTPSPIDRLYQSIYEAFRSYVSDEISEKHYSEIKKIEYHIDRLIRKKSLLEDGSFFKFESLQKNFFSPESIKYRDFGKHEYLYNMLSLYSQPYEMIEYRNDPIRPHEVEYVTADFKLFKNKAIPIFNTAYKRNEMLKSWFIKYRDEKGGEYILPKEERLFFVDYNILDKTLEFKLFNRLLDKLLIQVDPKKISLDEKDIEYTRIYLENLGVKGRLNRKFFRENLIYLGKEKKTDQKEFFIPETAFHFLYNYFNLKEIDRDRLKLQLISLNHPEIKTEIDSYFSARNRKAIQSESVIKGVQRNIDGRDQDKTDISLYIEYDSLEYQLASEELTLEKLDSLLNRATSSFSFEKLIAPPPSVLTNIEWNSIPNTAAVEDIFLMYKHIVEHRKKLAMVYIEPEAFIFRDSRGEVVDPFTAKFDRRKSIDEQLYIRIFVRRDYIDTKHGIYDNSISESYLISLKDLQYIIDRESYHELVTRPLNMVKMYQGILSSLLSRNPEQHFLDLQKLLKKAYVYVSSRYDIRTDRLDSTGSNQYSSTYLEELLSILKDSSREKDSIKDILLNIDDPILYRKREIEIPEYVKNILKQTDILINIDPIVNIAIRNRKVYEFLTDLKDIGDIVKNIVPTSGKTINSIPSGRYEKIISSIDTAVDKRYKRIINHRELARKSGFFIGKGSFFSRIDRQNDTDKAVIERGELDRQKHPLFKSAITFRSSKYTYNVLNTYINQIRFNSNSENYLDSKSYIKDVLKAFIHSERNLDIFLLKLEEFIKKAENFNYFEESTARELKKLFTAFRQYTPDHTNYEFQIIKNSYKHLKAYSSKTVLNSSRETLTPNTIFDSLYQYLKIFHSNYLKDPKLVDSEKYNFNLEQYLTDFAKTSDDSCILLSLGENRDRQFFNDIKDFKKEYSFQLKKPDFLKNFPGVDADKEFIYYRDIQFNTLTKIQNGESRKEIQYIINNQPYSRARQITGTSCRLYTAGETSLIRSQTIAYIPANIFFRDVILPFYTYNLFIDKKDQSNYIHLAGTSINRELIREFLSFTEKLHSKSAEQRMLEEQYGEKFYLKERLKDTLLKSKMNIFTFLLDNKITREYLNSPVNFRNNIEKLIDQFKNFIPRDSSLFISKQLFNLEAKEKGIAEQYDVTQFLREFDSIKKDPILFFKTNFPEIINDFKKVKDNITHYYKFDIVDYIKHLRQAKYSYNNILKILIDSKNPSLLSSENFYKTAVKLGRLEEFKQAFNTYRAYMDPVLREKLEKVYGISVIIDRFARQVAIENGVDLNSLDHISRRKLVNETMKRHKKLIKSLTKKFLLKTQPDSVKQVEKTTEKSMTEDREFF